MMKDDIEIAQRVAGFAFTPQLLLSLLKRFKVEGIPDDAKFQEVYTDHGSRSVVFVIESEKFHLVPPGAPLPLLSITVTN